MVQDAVSVGELSRAKRRAVSIFDQWQRVTGCLEGSSYTWEIQSIIEDAVEIGVQEAMGIYRQLESEKDVEHEGAETTASTITED